MIRKFIAPLLDPFILMLMGTVLVASIAPPRGIWVGIFDIIKDAGIVLLFFLHGAKLSREAIIAGGTNWRLHATTLSVTYILFPLLGLALSMLPLLDAPLMAGLLFLTLLPSTVQSSIAFTAIARGNVAAALCSASFSNLAGIFLTPALVAILMHAQGGGPSADALRAIILQLLLPFCIGHLLRPAIGGFVARHKQLVTTVDRGSVLLVVYAAFGAAVVSGLWHSVSASDLGVLIAICCALLAIVLTATWALGKVMGFQREDAIVLLFCGSKKSLATGVPMAGVLFPPVQIGMIILPVMLFHQIQLVACAIIARHYGSQTARSSTSAV